MKDLRERDSNLRPVSSQYRSGDRALMNPTGMVIAFLGCFVWAFGWGFDPPVPMIGTASAVAIFIELVIAVTLPLHEVHVIEVKRVLRFAGEEVAFDAVLEIVVEEEAKTNVDEETSRHLHCELVRSIEEGGDARAPILIFNRRSAADAFSEWLRERTGIIQRANQEPR